VLRGWGLLDRAARVRGELRIRLGVSNFHCFVLLEYARVNGEKYLRGE
jgi:hypothetical protein